MRNALLTLVAFGGGWTSALAADPAPANPKADGLIARLASPSYAEREAATKSLQELGTEALPGLKKAQAENSNPEVQTRVANIVAKIQLDADVASLTQGKPVALDFQDKPLNVALAELRTKTGIPLTLHTTVQDPARSVTVKTDALPPWIAIEKFCVAAGLTEQLKPDAKAEVKPQTGRRPIRRNVENYDGPGLGAQLLGRPGDVAVILVDGLATLPADRRGGVRIQALPMSYPGSGIDPIAGELTLHLDVAPQAGLNWTYTSEIRIGKAKTSDGKELQTIWKPDVVPLANPYDLEQFQVDSIEIELPVKSTRTNPRVLPLTFKIDAGELKSLSKLDGLILGEIAQPNQPIVEVAELATALGQTFAGPNDSSLTIVSMTTDEKSKSTTLVLRASCTSAWAVRQVRQRVGTNDSSINFQSFAKIRYFDADGKAMTQPLVRQSSSSGDGVRETYEVSIRFGTTGATAPKPVKMVLHGTKIVPVALPFSLKDVPLE